MHDIIRNKAGKNMKSTFKQSVCLILVLAFSVFLFGCNSQKPMELSENDYNLVEEATRMAVSHELLSKYGKDAGLTIEKTTAYNNGDTKFRSFTFYTTGSYAVLDSSGKLYNGTFKVMGHVEEHGFGYDECEVSEPKCGSETLPTLSTTETEEATSNTTTETSKPEIKSDDMNQMAEAYKKAGYTIMILNPADEFEQCYGALEHFRAYNNTRLVEVYLYENTEAAENAKNMMFGEGPDRTSGAVPDTEIVNDRILVAEYK